MFPHYCGKRDTCTLLRENWFLDRLEQWHNVKLSVQPELASTYLDQWLIPNSGRQQAHERIIKFICTVAIFLQIPSQHYSHEQFDRFSKLVLSLQLFLKVCLKHCVGSFTCFQAVLLWQIGKLFLLYMPNTEYFRNWKARLEELNVRFDNYSFERFRSRSCVYLLLNLRSTHFYIGATDKSMAGRYGTRLRAYRVLLKTPLIQCEVALRFWKNTRTFFEYFPIVMEVVENKHMAFVREAELQDKWQPTLCMPWIQKLQRTPQAPTAKSMNPSSQGSRLFQRYRKRLHGEVGEQTRSKKHHNAMHQLYSLGSFRLARFQTSRLLRSRDGPDDDLHLYFLFRMCKHLDAPYCNRAQREITKILRFRELPIPLHPQPLRICLLAHNSFEKELRGFLISFVRKHKPQWTPLHWPSSEVAEGKHVTIADIIHNWKQHMQQWQWQPPETCNCKELLNKFRDLPTNGGHIAGGLASQFLPAHIQFLGATSTKDGCYRPKQAYIQYGFQQLRKWLPKQWEHLYEDLYHGWLEVVENSWPKHLRAVLDTKKFQVADISALKQYLPGLVFHNEDHHPHKLCVYCPVLYFRLIQKTFHDKNVFSLLEQSPVLFRSQLLVHCPAWVKHKYSWGIKETGTVPYAYILPKGKKNYSNARPIIASSGSSFATLFQALGKLLADILPLAYPGTFGYRTMAQILTDIRMFLQRPENISDKFDFCNEDLKGFFTSVPHEVILQSVIHLISTYNSKFPPMHGKDTVFTVTVKSSSKERCIRGRSFSKTAKNHIIHLADLPDLVLLALKSSAFQCMTQMFQQDRGAIIGGHASPSICSMAVAYREFTWLRAYKIQEHADMLCIRYVDNRLTVISKELRKLPSFERFCNLLFYQSPIELEDCGDNVLLGYEISLTSRYCRYVVPKFNYDFRSIRSAGSTSRILSGLNARLHLLYRGTFPKSDSHKLVSLLLQGYVRQGFSLEVVKRAAFKICNKYRSNSV